MESSRNVATREPLPLPLPLPLSKTYPIQDVSTVTHSVTLDYLRRCQVLARLNQAVVHAVRERRNRQTLCAGAGLVAAVRERRGVVELRCERRGGVQAEEEDEAA